MDTSSIALLGGITRRMNYLTARQNVVADNIANANTPGYEARDVRDQDFSALVSKLGERAAGAPRIARPAIAMPAGMARLGAGGGDGAGSVKDRDVFETTPTGNTVSVEDQLMTMAKVQMDYTTMLNLYRRQTGMLRTAIGQR